MNWDDLRFFLAVCREGSVTAAGQRLSVNHTTVARRLSALEDVRLAFACLIGIATGTR